MPDDLKQKFLEALNSNNELDLINIFKPCHSHLAVSKALHYLHQDQQDHVWKHLYQIVEKNLLVSECNLQEDLQMTHSTMISVLSFARFFLGSKNIYVSPYLKEIVLMLSAQLNHCSSSLRSKITDICEMCLTLDWAEADLLGLHLVLYLIQRTLVPQAKRTDLRRVWRLRSFISAILHKEGNENAESRNFLCSLLEQCFLSPVYIAVKEGQMFLSFIFGCKGDLFERFYNHIKWCFPQCSKMKAEAYGKVIFRAWLCADEIVKKKIEDFCIQELIYYAIHMDKCMIPLRIILTKFHSQKKQPSVSTMLLNLYDPIIWRSLQVANGYVRANAAVLFFDAFPLESPLKSLEENDQTLQNQYHQMKTLLEDSYPVVRSTSCIGLCSFLCSYWEMVPSQVLNELLNALIEGPLNDGSSMDVRMAAIKGLTTLLDNPLTHPTLKVLLPKAQMRIHDTSEKVRILFCNMLIKIKSIPSIQYWDIVPVDHLMARLEIETVPVSRCIVELIYNSYLPKNRPHHSKLERCIVLIESSRLASRVFFKHIHRCIALEEIGNFFVYICEVLKKHFEEKSERMDSSELDNENVENNIMSSPTLALTKDVESPLDNINVVGGLIDAVAIFLSTSGYSLRKETLKDKLKRLLGSIAESVPSFFRHLRGTEIWESVIYLFSFLAPIDVPILASHCISYLKHLKLDTEPSEFTYILISLCIHGKATDVLELIEEWVELGLRSRFRKNVPKKFRQQKKNVKFDHYEDSKPLLAIRFLEALINNALCLKVILQTHLNPLYKVWLQLQNVKEVIEQFLAASFSLEDASFYDILEASFSSYCIITILLHKKEQFPEFSAVPVMQQNIVWGNQFLLPFTNYENTLDETERSNGSGKKRQSQEWEDKINLAFSLAKVIIMTSTDMFQVGVTDDNLCHAITEFTGKVLQSNYIMFVPFAMKLVYHISNSSLVLIAKKKEDNISIHVATLISVINSKMINVDKLENFSKPYISVLPIFKDILSSRFNITNGLDSATQEIVCSFVELIMKEVIDHLKNEHTINICNKIDELPPLTAQVLKIWSTSSNYFRLFLKKFSAYFQSGELNSLFDGFAALHLLNTIMLDSDSCNIEKKDLEEALLKAETFCCKTSIPFAEHWSFPANSNIEDCLTTLYHQVARFLMETEHKE